MNNRQDQGNQVIFTQEFKNGSNYYDPDDNLLVAEIQNDNGVKLFDCSVVRRSAGVYDITVFYPVGYENVILYLIWSLNGLRKAKGYNVQTIYASGRIDPVRMDQSDLILSFHVHGRLNVLEKFSEVDGSLYYNGVAVGSGGGSGTIGEIDGGTANSVYVVSQVIDGGNV